MSKTDTPRKANNRYPVLSGFQRALGILNDILLIPMFASIIMEATTEQSMFSASSNLIFCALFFTEWMLGLLMSDSRLGYIKKISNILDLISVIPVGSYFQGFRLFRLTRIIKVGRVVLRTKRYHGPGKDLLRVAAVVGATTFAGAYTILIVEGSAVPADGQQITLTSFGDALWWALVTISTVGYGDLYPVTTGGRLVAVALILVGVGVCGYIAGFMANLVSMDDESEEIQQMKRLEHKLDALARHMAISDWEFREDTENVSATHQSKSS
ncbi:MAG: potassium channel family protein [Myxococcota bacterium]|nr:potassium channel family protein [Myxococcota bacterium]